MSSASSARLAALAACLVMLALTSCGSRDEPSSTAPTAATANPAVTRMVGPEEFAAGVNEPARVTINVHVPFEGDIPGTDLSIPYDQIVQRAAELPADKNTPLALYCRSGPMSTTAAAKLHELGYTDIVELKGGMRAWQQSGRPMIGQ